MSRRQALATERRIENEAIERRITGLLRDASEPLTLTEIAKALKLPVAKVDPLLFRLKFLEVVSRTPDTRDGAYRYILGRKAPG